MERTRIICSGLIFVILVMSITYMAGGFVGTPPQVEATGFKVKEEKVLIAEKNGSIQINLNIEPADTYPIDVEFGSSDDNVATATMGAIDKNGQAHTLAEIQRTKDNLAKKDKTAAEKIVIPTNTAIITAKNWGECNIKVTMGAFSDNIEVVAANKRLALTFDDGACRETSKLLKGLKEENVKATFFIVGQMTRRDDDHIKALEQAVNDGHEIGNHTYNHNAGADTLKKELAKADKVIEDAGGKKTTLMRPPGGAINKATRKCGKSIIMWSFDTLDWKYRNADKVKNKLINKAKNNDIVLLHDLHKTTVKGTLKAIKPLKEKGFMFVTVTELLGDPKPNKEYEKGIGKLTTQVLR